MRAAAVPYRRENSLAGYRPLPRQVMTVLVEGWFGSCAQDPAAAVWAQEQVPDRGSEFAQKNASQCDTISGWLREKCCQWLDFAGNRCLELYGIRTRWRDRNAHRWGAKATIWTTGSLGRRPQHRDSQRTKWLPTASRPSGAEPLPAHCRHRGMARGPCDAGRSRCCPIAADLVVWTHL